MAATHALAMTLLGRTRRSDQLNQVEVQGGLAVKLLRTFTLQAEALAKLRRGGGQTVRVEHVHVHPGGQAIVGAVTTGGGSPMKNEEQPHAKPAALAHADARFNPLRSASAWQSPAMLNGRCRMHGGPSPGAPLGNQRAYKHGLYGREVRAVRAMVRSLADHDGYV